MSADLDSWTPPELGDEPDDDLLEDGGPQDEPPAEDEEERTRAFNNPEEFFTEFLAPHIQRRYAEPAPPAPP
ncbi:hypothetical protein SMC26_08575 [Actinomadura fulvescens]|uniref:Uncharacterized protein n=1 Tax=Actinomadura fulvescens TaxID=46160 RepID=A0ABN3QU15_9ACTN